jgi:hypothetical protein
MNILEIFPINKKNNNTIYINHLINSPNKLSQKTSQRTDFLFSHNEHLEKI